MTEHQPMPVSGYTSQSDHNIGLVNLNKQHEEKMLRFLDTMVDQDRYDQRWLAIARTNFEQAYMALNRSIFKPQRVKLNGETE